MIILSANRLSKGYGTDVILTDVSFHVNAGDRVGIVGRNGAGKTTLLKLLTGELTADEGEFFVSQDTRVGYLKQRDNFDSEGTVIGEIDKIFSEIHDLEAQIEQVSAEIEAGSSGAAQMEKLDRLHLAYEQKGGYTYKSEITGILHSMAFTSEFYNKKIGSLSGGERTRLALAALLLEKPDLLLLDEPTNHLDIESIQWLENFLATKANAVVLVSHDRAFINNVTNRTLEISCGRVFDYKVKYDEYVRLRAERREQQLRAYENQQKEIADIKEFIERFRYKPTKAVQVQSRIKQLEKMVPIEVDEVDNSALRLKFPPALRSGDYPLICEGVRKAYGEHVVFHDVDLTIKRGEKVAFVGKNGEGKSTLVKCIMGEIPFEGNLKLGHNVQIGYFAQNQAQLLDGELTVFDTIDRVAKGDIRLKIRDILGAFMFGGEASEKKVKVLSGGERSRLAMIKLLLEPVNFLILDEPTNHLDMRSKDVLKDAIRDFDGTVVVVSHDREFLDGLVSKVYEFGGGLVKEHLGGIYDFLQRKNIESLNDLQKPSLSTSSTMVSFVEEKTGASNRLSYEQQKEQQKKVRRLEKAVEQCEARIGELEAAVKMLEDQLATPEGAADVSIYERHGALKKQLDEAVNAWEEASLELEEAQS